MAGRLQNEDIKSLAELTGAGGSMSQLINDSKIYVASLSEQLSQAISSGDLANIAAQWKASVYTNADSGSDINLELSTGMMIVCNGSSVTSIASLNASNNGRMVVLVNIGASLTIKNQSGAGAVNKKIYTGTGADVTLAQNSAMFFLYVSSLSSWVLVGSAGSGGSGITALTGSVTASGTGSQVAKLNAARAIENITLTASVGSNAMTIALKTASGTDASASDPINVGMRSSTLSSGTFNIRQVTGALSLTVSAGSTLGFTSATNTEFYVYLLDNAGTLELAVAKSLWNDSKLITTVAEGGAGAADAENVMYSTTARTNVPFRCIGKILAQNTTGNWTVAPSQLSIGSYETFSDNYVVSAKYGIGAGDIINSGVQTFPNFSTKLWDTHNCVTVGVGAWSAAAGGNATSNWKFTPFEPGEYIITYGAFLYNGAAVAWAASSGFYAVVRDINNAANLGYIFSKDMITTGTTTLGQVQMNGSIRVKLAAAQAIAIRVFQNSGTNIAQGNNTNENYVEITKIGKY